MPELLPPLSLYVHFPWCVRKCPYCDFNSHPLRGELEEEAYVDALLRDLAHEAPPAGERAVRTVFFGGGTPSLFSPEAVARLLAGIRGRVAVAGDAEITLEANPGTVEVERFRGFRDAGVNRLSIGIQSFDDAKLEALGRIHGRKEALRAARAARQAGFRNFNLDLMYGLPGQTLAEAREDVATAIALEPAHLSAYQLTLEPNTYFCSHPPELPDEDTLAAMQETIEEDLAMAGFAHYEVSAYARAGFECRHNRNYWEFGDYLGIGAGAHGKISAASGVRRTAKVKHPNAYLARAGSDAAYASRRALDDADRLFEFMLNALRLHRGFEPSLFARRTGLPLDRLSPGLRAGRRRGLLEDRDDRIVPTPLGRRFLDDAILLFAPEQTDPARVAPMERGASPGALLA